MVGKTCHYIKGGGHIPDGVIIGHSSLITASSNLEAKSVYAGIPPKKIHGNVYWKP